MELGVFFRSIIEQDECAVVVCNSEHKIIYMNPAACENYSKYGGDKLIGKSILDCHNEKSKAAIIKVVQWFAMSPSHNKVHTGYNQKQMKDLYMVALRDESGKLIGYYEKHEFRTVDSSPLYQMD